ncbi:MAG: PAS-domain containing protein [Pseudomonadota bacterium]
MHQISVEAADILGNCLGKPIVRVLESFLQDDSVDVRDAVNRLEMTGDPVNMLVYDRDSRAFELIGAPAGGLIKLILRDAGYLDTRLKAAEERISAADALVQGRNWERVTLRGLMSDAPIIAWNRTAEGGINWADGTIRLRNGAVTADQAVDLIVARTKLNNQPALVGQPQKSRIEIVINDGSDTISLHVTEVVRANGDRIGFATDASTAASAERTLTRFVQTMTETFAHLTVGLAIFDRNQTLALFNPALVQMWQLEPAWLARRPSLRDIVDELRASRRLPELQDFHKWRTELLNLFENTEAADYEELWHLANGSNIRVLARPHPHGSLAFIFDDVTERMRLEQRYRHSIDLRRVTLDRLNEGIAVFGANGLLQFINQAFHDIWGTNSEVVYAAMHIRQFIPMCQQLSPDSDIWRRLHSFVTGEDNRREWEAQVTTQSGFTLNARFSPLPDGSTMAVFTNISDSQRISKQFAQKAFSLRFSLAVRDYVVKRFGESVRAPLAQIAQQGPIAAKPDDAGKTEIAPVVARIDELLDLAEMAEAGSAEGAQNIDLRGVVQIGCDLLRNRADRDQVALGMAEHAGAVTVQGDKCLLTQVSFAMGLMAFELVGQGSEIEFSVDAPAPDYCIVLSGTALGVSPTQIQAAAKMREVVENLVERHRGVLTVSEAQATGKIRIEARFGPAAQTGDLVDPLVPDGITDNDDASNVLRLPPSAAQRD